MRAFSIADVLTITTGHLHGEMDGVYEILSHMTGDTLFTHQLLRAMRVCGPVLRERFPHLPTDGHHPELAATSQTFEVPPLPEGAWESKDPVAEAVELVGKDRVVVVRLGTEPSTGGK